MKKKRKLKKKFIVFFLLYFVLISSIFIIRTFSKYSGSINKTGNTSVAEWDVSANIPDATITVAPVDEETYNLTVTSNSEVSVSYSMKVSNLPARTYVSVDGGKYSNGGNNITLSNVGTIKASDSIKTKTHTLKFKTAPEVTESTNRNVTIDVIFKQNKPQ